MTTNAPAAPQSLVAAISSPRKALLGPHKRIIVACDGTWLDSDNGLVYKSWLPWNTSGHLQVPSNVTRLCRGLKPVSDSGMPQLIFYQAGLGNGNDLWTHFVGGATGLGISENIRACYEFVASNYQQGDEIFLIGFSRGAYTARSVAALIAAMGLLTRVGMLEFSPIFADWENQSNPNYVRHWPNRPFALGRENAGELVRNGAYAKRLEELGFTTLDVPIKAVGVFETVGALGIPSFGLWKRNWQEYAFIDSKVSPRVEYAFQALALDEHRAKYRPTVWEQPTGQTRPKLLKQCWFPGVHTNIGGGYPDTEIADMTLSWLMSQLDPLLDFFPEYVQWQRRQNAAYYERENEPVRPWSCGKILNSSRGLRFLAGSKVRTPGQYTATDPVSGETTSRPLQNTNEQIHPSVRVRNALGGRGVGDKGQYIPAALSEKLGWRVAESGDGDSVGQSSEAGSAKKYLWVLESEGSGKVVLPEETLGDLEVELLKMSPDAYSAVLGVAPKRTV